MSEKFRIVRLKENPTSRRAARPRRRVRRRRKRAKIHRRPPLHSGFVVEGLHQVGHKVRFLYWTGAKFSAEKRAAKIYRREKDAESACRASMKRRARAYRLARVVRA
jgi:hypothetical protein